MGASRSTRKATYARSTLRTRYTTMPHSDSSVESTRSHRSQGPVNIVPGLTSERTRKVPARWTVDEERSLIDYLSNHKSEAGDAMNFKMTTFRAAAEHIKQAYAHQQGGEKTADACRTKWGNVHQEKMHMQCCTMGHT